MLNLNFASCVVPRCAMFLLAALLLPGCVSEPAAPDQSTPYLQGARQASAEFYLQQMPHGQHHIRTNWQLLAIRALLADGKTTEAQALYQQLPDKLTPEQLTEKTLLTASLQLANKDYPAVHNTLTKLEPGNLSPFNQQRYWQAQIDADQGVPSLALLRALIAQQPLLTGQQQQQNINQTWQALTRMTTQQASQLVINANEYTLQGWLDLRLVWLNNRSDPGLLQDSVKSWQTRYPQNPAAKTLPEGLLQASSLVSSATAERIALLLPLNGQGSVFAAAIEQGFEMAKNTGTSPVIMPVTVETVTGDNPSAASSAASEEAMPDDHQPANTPANAADSATPPPAARQPDDLLSVLSPADGNDLPGQADHAAESPPANPAPAANAALPTDALLAGSVPANPGAQLKIYDTTTQPMAQLLAQVQQDGADIVIGPLLKDNVAALQNTDTSLNILALNQPETTLNTPSVCYFALSPDDETRDAAAHIWQQGHRQPLLLLPRGLFGQRVSQVFTAAWQQLGGDIVLQQTFDSVSDLKQQINHNSGIRLTGTPVILQNALDAAPQNPPLTANEQATGIDAVYIVASPSELALIKPMITMSTGSRSKVEFYASSRSVQGGEEVDYRFEMEGLQFSEIPMLAGANPAFMRQALTTLHSDYSLARLYAMGADAWTLANNFAHLRQQPGFTVHGNTGQLTADANCVIHRKLTWLKYQQGKVVPVLPVSPDA